MGMVSDTDTCTCGLFLTVATLPTEFSKRNILNLFVDSIAFIRSFRVIIAPLGPTGKLIRGFYLSKKFVFARKIYLRTNTLGTNLLA
jgi:hypothetical protein